MVEYLLAMQKVRVQLPVPTPICAGVAQMAERLTCNKQVTGSIPVTGPIGKMAERPKAQVWRT